MEPVLKLTRIKVYNCEQCGEMFSSEDRLEKHSKDHIPAYIIKNEPETRCSRPLTPSTTPILVRKHSGLSSYPCHFCGGKYMELEDLQVHIESAHQILQENLETTKATVDENESKFETKYDNFQNSDKDINSTIKREVTAPSEDKFAAQIVKKRWSRKPSEQLLETNADATISCRICSKIFPKKTLAAAHSKSVHSLYTCEYCYKDFSGRNSILTHVNKEHTKQFSCAQCGKVFGNKCYLNTHMTTHLDKNERPYICTICDQRFTQTTGLKAHYKRMHTRIRDKVCSYCPKAFYDSGALDLHMRTHTGVKPYTCSYCKKSFSDPSAFQRHIRTHTKEMRYFCTECPMKFTDASGLIAHRRRHSGTRNFACQYCDKKFYDLTTMKNHITVIHSFTRNFECHHCARTFGTKPAIQNHILKVHAEHCGRMYNYECYYCGKRHSYKNSLQQHIYKYHGKEFGKAPKYVTCRLCNKIYHYDDFNRHIVNIHETKAKHECDYCGRRFRQKSSLVSHFYSRHRKESGLKVLSFPCPRCKKVYFSKGSLEYHIKDVHGIVVYCDKCSGKFRSAQGLEIHKRYCKKKGMPECKPCRKIFANILNLQRHNEQKHQ